MLRRHAGVLCNILVRRHAAATASSLSSTNNRAFAAQAEEQEQQAESIQVNIGVPYERFKLNDGPAQSAQTSPQQLMHYFRQMTTIRRMEIAADMLFKSQQIRGFCHLYDGQEAVAIGMEAALTYDDAVITAYRDHGNYIGRGGDVFETFSELMGKASGPALGKGGSMHLYKRKNNFFGGWGIVGTTPPLGAGLAFALKYQQKKNVAVAIYGDGAANQGQIFEAANMAALWELPLILLVENNHYGMGTAEWRACKKTTFYDRISYIPGLKVDGMDLFSVKNAVKFAKEFCLSGKGPIVLECDTYRYHGHSMSDPGSTYRTRTEIQGIRQQRDPIENIRKIITKEGVASAEDLKNIEKDIRREVDAAATKAREASQPGEEELFSNIYKLDSGLQTFGCDRKKSAVQMP